MALENRSRTRQVVYLALVFVALVIFVYAMPLFLG